MWKPSRYNSELSDLHLSEPPRMSSLTSEQHLLWAAGGMLPSKEREDFFCVLCSPNPHPTHQGGLNIPGTWGSEGKGRDGMLGKEKLPYSFHT